MYRGELGTGSGMENLVLIGPCRRSEIFTRFSVFYWGAYGRS
jgi:hypothetical protein